MFTSWWRRRRTQPKMTAVRTLAFRPRRRLEFESLEQRLAPATLLVNAGQSFTSALTAAHPGDTIQIAPTGSVGNLQLNTGHLISAAAAGATTIDVDEPFTPGQVITITSGTSVDTELIDAVAVSGVAEVLTLHDPLGFAHTVGSAVAPVTKTLGIDKPVTIQGDPAHPAANLLGGLTLEYFPQSGTPGADVLRNLALTAVDGTAGGSLSISDDQFNIVGGTTDPVNVTCFGNVSIAGDTFSIASSAAIRTVISTLAFAGSTTVSNDSISVAGNSSGDAVDLFDEFGPVSLSGMKLTTNGTVGGSGVLAISGGDVSVSSTTLNLKGAVTEFGMEAKGAICSVSNITVNTGADVGATGFRVLSGGGATVSGTNTVTIAGNAGSDGMDITGSGALNVSNVTVTVKGNVGRDALADASSGPVTLTNAKVTVGGNVTNAGIDMSFGTNGTGTLTFANTVVTIVGTAGYGLYAYTGGNMSVGGTENVVVGGAVANDGMHLESVNGNINVSTGISVKLGANTVDGLKVYAGSGNMSVSGAVQVLIGGAATGNGSGAYLLAGSSAVVAAITVSVAHAAGFGATVEGSTLAVNGPIKVAVGGVVKDDGANIYAFTGDLTIAGHISVTLGSDADYGLYIDSETGGLHDTGALSVSVAGNCGNAGASILSDASMTLAASVNVTVGGTAHDGLILESLDPNTGPHSGGSYLGGSVTDTAGITVGVKGAVTDGVFVQGTESATLANVKVALADLADGTGLYVQTEYAALNVSSVNIIANGGSAKAYGVSLSTYNAALNAKGVNVNMTGQAEYGLYVESGSTAAVTAASVKISAAVAGAGIYADAASTLAASGLTVALHGSAEYGMDLSGLGVNIDGPLSAAVTGALSGEGIYLSSSGGNTSVAGPITVNVGAAADSGLYLAAGEGNLAINGNIVVRVAGDVTEGAFLQAAGNETLSGNIAVSVGGTAEYGIEAYTSNGALSNSGTIAVSVAGQVTEYGAYLGGEVRTTLSNITVTLGDGSTNVGAYVDGNDGNLSLSNFALSVTGPVTDQGVYLYSRSASISTSHLNVKLSSTAGYGIYADVVSGSVTMSNTTLSVGGNLTGDGVYVVAGSAITVSGTTAVLKGASSYAFYASASFNAVAVSGLTLSETGSTSDDGMYAVSGGGNVALTNSAVTLGPTLKDGIYASADEGSVTVAGVSLKATGNIEGDGLDVSSQGNSTVAGDTLSFNNGVNVSALHVASGGNATINKNTIAVKVGSAVGIETAVAGSLMLSGNIISLLQQGTAALLNGSSGNPQTIIGNSFDTNGGTGLAFSGGYGVVALVQANNFQGNMVGVQITGDTTYAGDIDLGGGDRGSTGGNNFHGFNGVAGHYAIVLTKTNSTSTVFAVGNLFSVGNPSPVIQDGTFNSYGVGTGIIKVA